MVRRRFLLFLGWVSFALIGGASAAEPPLAGFKTVEIAPTKTSIYVGTVSLTMPVLQRNNITYSATYVAKVFPFFFESENGELSIDIPNEDLIRLARGEVVNFVGRGKNSDGQERRIEGRAIPADAQSGKIKVRVFVSKKIQLIFNTTYRFPQA